MALFHNFKARERIIDMSLQWNLINAGTWRNEFLCTIYLFVLFPTLAQASAHSLA